jgi:hypothetical protein
MPNPRKCLRCKRPARQTGSYYMCIPSEGGCGHIFGKGVDHGGGSVCDSGDSDSTVLEEEETNNEM